LSSLLSLGVARETWWAFLKSPEKRSNPKGFQYF